MGPGPLRKLRRLLTRDLVGERDRVARIRTEIRVGFEVGEHRCHAVGARKPAGEDLARDLRERDLVSLSVQGGDDLVEAQEIADQRQVLTVPCEFALRKRAGHDAAEFRDRETALRMWTENVTWFSNEEGKKGRIEAGQLADRRRCSSSRRTP